MSPVPCPPGDFADQVRDALAHLHDYAYLQTHPLATALALAPGERVGRGRALSGALTDAIAALGPPGSGAAAPGDRRHQALVLRHVEGLAVDEAAARLAVGRRQFYREHAGSVAAVVSLLAERGADGAPEARTPDAPAQDEPTRASPGREQLPPETAEAGRLPTPLTSLVGRVPTILQLAELLRWSRLVTLTGPPGTGKTRLSLAVALRFAEAPTAEQPFPDGVHFVELAPVGEASHVMPTVLQALGVWPHADAPPLATLIEHLRERRALLVLDNFEHVLPAAADVVALLTRCPRLTVLVTSRAALSVTGERAVLVPPLTLPDAAPPADVEELVRAEAVRLFVERAQGARSTFALSAANGPAVARICRALDGLPLAIELAAARTRVLSAEQIAARLAGSLDVLGDTGPTTPEHHRGLRGAIDWSYGLLSAEERTVFRRLSVFAGGFEIEAAARVCAVGHPLELLDGLVEQSLVVAEERDGAMRFRLLETMRQYAAERLRADDDEAACRGRHLEWCASLGEDRAQGQLDPARAALMAREVDNIRAALAWCRDSGDTRSGLHLLGRTYGLWYLRGPFAEMREWLDQLSALDGGREPSDCRADVLASVASVLVRTCDYAGAEALLAEAYATAVAVGDGLATAQSLHVLGNVAIFRGDLAAARQRMESAREINRREGRAFWEAVNLSQLGRIAVLDGRLDDAGALAAEGLVLARRVGYVVGEAAHLRTLGQLHARTGRHARGSSSRKGWRWRAALRTCTARRSS